MLIYGKQVAADTRAEIATGVAAFEKKYCRKPCLAVIIVGEDPASQTYVRNKIKGCAEVGMASLSYEYGDTTPQEEIAAKLRELAADDNAAFAHSGQQGRRRLQPDKHGTSRDEQTAHDLLHSVRRDEVD